MCGSLLLNLFLTNYMFLPSDSLPLFIKVPLIIIWDNFLTFIVNIKTVKFHFSCLRRWGDFLIALTLVQNRFSARVEERLSEVVWLEKRQVFRRSLK